MYDKNLIYECLQSKEWERNATGIKHKSIDVIILDSDIFIYTVMFNFHDNNNLFLWKNIEKSLNVNEQVRLLDLFIEIYGKERS